MKIDAEALVAKIKDVKVSKLVRETGLSDPTIRAIQRGDYMQCSLKTMSKVKEWVETNANS